MLLSCRFWFSSFILASYASQRISSAHFSLVLPYTSSLSFPLLFTLFAKFFHLSHFYITASHSFISDFINGTLAVLLCVCICADKWNTGWQNACIALAVEALDFLRLSLRKYVCDRIAFRSFRRTSFFSCSALCVYVFLFLFCGDKRKVLIDSTLLT